MNKFNWTVLPVAWALLVCNPAHGASGKQSSPQVIEIHAKKFGYLPSEITLHKGKTYKLHLTSDDVEHSLRIREWNMNAEMNPGQFDDVLITPDKAGDYVADCGHYCGTGHKAMKMAIHVVDK